MYDMQCPGCGHRTAMMLIDQTIDELNIKNKIIVGLDVACCSLLIDELRYDAVMCPHGRVLPVCNGIKKVQHEKIVISYMGDGAAYAIGTNEMIHAAHRNDDALCIVINNGLFAMTGGQIPPSAFDEKAFDIVPLLKNMDIPFLARESLSNRENIYNCRKYMKEMFESYMTNGGFHLLELLSPCPTNNHMSVKENVEYINVTVSKILKCGRFI